MIQCSTENLPEEQSTKLKLWLNRPEAMTCEKVVAGRVKELQTKALNDAVSAKDNVNLLGSISMNMTDAQRYQTFLDVLEELRSATSFKTVRLS